MPDPRKSWARVLGASGRGSVVEWCTLVVCRARSVALLRSLNEAASRPASSLVSILAWKTWSTALEFSAEAACPTAKYVRPASADVALHNLDGWLALAFLTIAMGGQRCAATESSRRRQVLVSFLFSTVIRCESSGRSRTDVRRIGGAPRFCELIVDFWKEGGRALADGLMVPREKPLVQPPTRWLLRRRPFEPELVDTLCHDTDESGVV